MLMSHSSICYSHSILFYSCIPSPAHSNTNTIPTPPNSTQPHLTSLNPTRTRKLRKRNGKLSCCGARAWSEPGCRSAAHDGLFFHMVNLRRPQESGSQLPNGWNGNGDGNGNGNGLENGAGKVSEPLFPLVCHPSSSSSAALNW